MKILIGGSHGLIGTALVEHLEEAGHQILRLARVGGAGGDVLWDPLTGEIERSSLEGFDAVIHLGGENIGEKRWTERTKQRIWDSRTNSAEILTNTLASLTYKPKVFLCASAIGFYGNRGEETLTERSGKGEGFLPDLCETWEEVTKPASDAGIRVVNLRSGIVQSNLGGPLPRQAMLFRSWAGGRLGSGKQWLSWVSLHDEIRAIAFCLQHPTISGPVNIVSPAPVTNIEFTHALSVALHRIAPFPSPRWMLSIVLGQELTDELLLTSQYVVPEKLQAAGFVFQDDDIYTLLEKIYQPEENEEDDSDEGPPGGPENNGHSPSSSPPYSR